MSKKNNLIGMTFGKLSVINEASERLSNRVTWLCICECGSYKRVTAKHLTTGVITTCNGHIHHSGVNSRSWKGTESICGKYFSQVRRGANSRQLAFKITITDMENLVKIQDGKCALTGTPLNFDTNNNGTASLDRIDSSKGYKIDNIQWVHKDVNRMKHDFSQEYFLTLCQQIVQHANTAKNL